MPSVADDLKRALREQMRAMTSAERIALALSLADADLDLFCRARQVSREEARRALARTRRTGRLPSLAAEGMNP